MENSLIFTGLILLAGLAGGLIGMIQPGLSAVLHNLTTLGVSLNAMRPTLGGR